MSSAKNLLRQSIEMGHFVTRAYVKTSPTPNCWCVGAGVESHRLATRPHDRQHAGNARRAGRQAPDCPTASRRPTPAKRPFGRSGQVRRQGPVSSLMDQMKSASWPQSRPPPRASWTIRGRRRCGAMPTIGAVLMLLGTHG